MNHTCETGNEQHRPDHRLETRFMTVLAVEVEGSEAWTRDVSATGVYFETGTPKPVGSLVNFLLEVMISGEKLSLVCEGEVVRVDQKEDGKVGIAARLRSSFFASETGDSTAARHADSVPAALDR